VGAGMGHRLGSKLPKCLIPINDLPIILITANAFQLNSSIKAIVLVVPESAVEQIQSEATLLGLDKICAVVSGGERRQDSALNGLNAVPDDIDNILIHDGARALVPNSLINRVLTALELHPVVIPANTVTDTLHKENGGFAIDGAERKGLVAAQTPQGFRVSLLKECFEKSIEKNYTVTDEATLIRDISRVNPAIVAGDNNNIKITFSEDLEFYMSHLIFQAEELKEKMD